MVGHAMEMSAPSVEPMREDKEEEEGEGVEEDRRKSSFSTGNLALGWLPTLQWAIPAAPTVQVALLHPEMDKELARWLQEEEVAAEEAQLGRDAAI